MIIDTPLAADCPWIDKRHDPVRRAEHEGEPLDLIAASLPIRAGRKGSMAAITSMSGTPPRNSE